MFVPPSRLPIGSGPMMELRSTIHSQQYDVVIVGGRPAGASLAARLGMQGIATLVIDRARFPAPPAVPSCAILYPQAMALLDDLGIEERSYSDPSALSRRFTIEVPGRFDTVFHMIEAHGRDYIMGIDRAEFDHTLWRHLARYPSVSTREGTSFRNVLRDEAGRVCGVQVQEGDRLYAIKARCVVGADGRFSQVAQRIGARVRESFDHCSTAHFATWEGALPDVEGAPVSVNIYTTARGLDVLFFPASGGRYYVCTHVRADQMRSEGPIEDWYARTLSSIPEVKRRLAPAKQTTRVVGLKRVANAYREAGGEGWVLVGDALHHKDPIDGQGIYDALLETKILAEELGAWHQGALSLNEAIARYDAAVLAQTHPMYEATTQRLQQELYGAPPTIVVRTVLRWLLTDEIYKQRFMQYLCRTIDPATRLTPALMLGAIARGMRNDLRKLVPGWRSSH